MIKYFCDRCEKETKQINLRQVYVACGIISDVKNTVYEWAYCQPCQKALILIFHEAHRSGYNPNLEGAWSPQIPGK